MDNLPSETMAGVSSRLTVVTEMEILLMLIFLECDVLSKSSYVLIELLSSILVNSGLEQIRH